jgi:predicted nucleotidyltransferase
MRDDQSAISNRQLAKIKKKEKNTKNKIIELKKKMPNKKLFSRLASYLKSRTEVILSYVYGSFLKGDLHEESDLDVAVLYKQVPNIQEQINLQNDLTKLTGYEVDLAVLNGASPIFIRQVLEKGREIHCSDDTAKHLFIIRILNEYDDLKYFRRSIEENILKGRIYA